MKSNGTPLFWTQALDRENQPVTVDVFYDERWVLRLASKAAQNKTKRCSYGPIKAIVRKERR